MAEQQLVKRRVYDNKDQLIREGLVPKDIANTREALMAFWEEQDRQDAEAEAAKAEKRAAELQAPQEPGAAELVEPLAERLASAEAELETLRGLKAATPEHIEKGVHQIARAAGAAALVEAAAQTAIATVDAAVAGAQALLKKIEGTVNQTAEAVGQLLADGRQSLEQTQAEMVAKTTSAISKRITKFEIDAAKMRGPKGDRGRIGQGLIAGAGKRPEKRPDGSDWAPGDSWLDTKAEGFQLSYMDAGGSWSQPARLVPAPKLVNAQQNVLDMAPRNSISLVQTGTGSGAGGGGEKLHINRIVSGGASAIVARSDNWAGVSDPQSGELMLDLRALDGTAASQSGFLLAAFTYDPVNQDQWTEYALIGELNNLIDVQLSVQRTNAVAPSGVTVTIPPGAQALQVWLRLTAKPGMGGSVNNVAVSGSIEWSHESLARAQDKNTPAPSPLWIYV